MQIWGKIKVPGPTRGSRVYGFITLITVLIYSSENSILDTMFGSGKFEGKCEGKKIQRKSRRKEKVKENKK